MGKNIRRLIKRLDVYPKFSNDIRKKTTFGGFIAFLSFISIITLFYLKIKLILFSPQSQKFVVNSNLIPRTASGKLDANAIPKMRINFDITLFHLPCALTYLDILDFTGESTPYFEGKVRMQRYDLQNHPIFSKYYPQNEAIESIESNKSNEEEKNNKNEKNSKGFNENNSNSNDRADDGYCGPCYNLKEKGCCNTCKEVRDLFKSSARRIPAIAAIEQCVRGGFAEEIKRMLNESCRVHGSFVVRQHPGSIIIGPGKPLTTNTNKIDNKGESIYEMLKINISELNLSHQIHHFGFGVGMNERHSPLDGNTEIQLFKGRMKMNYFLRIVPIGTNGLSFSYGSSSMQNYRNENSTNFPDVIFSYDLSPITVVKVNEFSYIEFVIQLTGMIGGVFAIATFVDSFGSSCTKSLGEETLPKAE